MSAASASSEDVFTRPAQRCLRNCHGGPRGRTRDEQRLLLTRGKRLDPPMEESAEILGDGKRFAPLELTSLELQGAEDLEGEQRVALRHVMHTNQQWTRHTSRRYCGVRTRARPRTTVPRSSCSSVRRQRHPAPADRTTRAPAEASPALRLAPLPDDVRRRKRPGRKGRPSTGRHRSRRSPTWIAPGAATRGALRLRPIVGRSHALWYPRGGARRRALAAAA